MSKSSFVAPSVRPPNAPLRHRWSRPIIVAKRIHGPSSEFYDEVISCLRPAEAIMVFGPGEAKGELRKRIERNKLDLRVTCFETSDKMTERQISQKVRRHYSPVDAARPVSRGSRR